MKRQTWFLLPLLLFILALTGCGTMAAAEEEPLEPLDVAAWPTLVPPTLVASPTPFPKATLDPTATPAPAAIAVEGNVVAAEEQSSTTASTAKVDQADTVASPTEGDRIQANSTALQAEPVSFSSSAAQNSTSSVLLGLRVVTTANIANNEVYVRPAPSTDYAAIDKLTDPVEQIQVLALDQSGNWALVQSVSAQNGWVAINDFTVQDEDALTEAPQIFTAWVESNAVEVRSGPGIFYDQTGQLAINSLIRVLGLDDSGSWAMIQPLPGGSMGWSPIQFLNNVGQPWASIPPAPDLPAPAQVAATAEPFTPARPVSESKIVFQRSSGGDIMVINPDGSGLHRLTGGMDPVLSPDGQTVAFTRWQGEEGSLWLIDIDGSDERQVLGFIKQAKGPDWSPDGTQIVLNFQHEGRVDPKSECVKLSDGRSPRPPSKAYDIKVKVKNGEPYLCWTLPPDPHWGLKVVDIADGSFEDMDGGTYAFRPAWDPAQSWRIVSDGGRGLLAVDVNQDNRQNLTDEVNDGSPVFSPDGHYLAVTTGSGGSDGGYDLYRLNADGSGRIQLTQTPLWVTSEPGDAKAWNSVAPTWSPDASQIAFLTDRAGRWEIWVMNADGSNPRPMFSDEINNQLQLEYNFVDERVLSWR